MLRITLLCNAGLILEYESKVLLVDLPNDRFEPFYTLPEEERKKIMDRIQPYDNICGLFYTHTHPDHCSRAFLDTYREKWPDVPVFLPQEQEEHGFAEMGPFTIEFQRMPHAPIPKAPPLAAAMIGVGEWNVYVASDADLDVEMHRAFLRRRQTDAAFWNAMYLSKADTRVLLHETTDKNYIYHMPADHEDLNGLWRKCRANFRRNGGELVGVTVLGEYPYTIELPE